MFGGTTLGSVGSVLDETWEQADTHWRNMGSGPPARESGAMAYDALRRETILFGGLDSARFRRQVEPGDSLELRVELLRMSARAGKGRGRALLRGETACECELMFVLVDR